MNGNSSDNSNITTNGGPLRRVNGHPEPDSTTNGFPDELEELIRRSLRGSASADMVNDGEEEEVDDDASGNGSASTNRNNSSNTRPPVDRETREAEAMLSEIESLNELKSLLDAENGEEHFELPRSLIVTNLDSRVFVVGSEERTQFEDTFRSVDAAAIFLYFRSFRRARVDFAQSVHATKARILCNQRRIGEEMINVYYAEVAETTEANRLLRPPALQKQFLISPPASPPEGWAPVEEAQPVLNFDLQSALANLIPGSAHELHPGTEDQPGIFVHIAPDTTTDVCISASSAKQPVDYPGYVEVSIDEEDELVEVPMPMPSRRKIPQTACPPAMAAASARREDN